MSRFLGNWNGGQVREGPQTPKTFTLEFQYASGKAACFTPVGDTREFWIPYSEMIETGADIERLSRGETVEITIPRWLAAQKELV
jgi:hypothetical protein